MGGLWNYINYDSSGVYMYGVLAGSVLGVGLLLVFGVVSAVSMGRGGWCTGLPGRPCGRHKMADYLLSAADVKFGDGNVPMSQRELCGLRL